MKYRVRRNSKVTCRTEAQLRFEAIPCFCKSVHTAPDKAIDGDDGCGHHDRCRKKQVEVASICSLADGGSQTDSSVDVAFEVKIFGDDARVPCAAGSGHEPGHQIGEYPGQDEFLPAFEACEPEN